MAEEQPIPRVVRDVSCVLLEHSGVFRFLEVKEDVAELNGPETHQVRAVRIAFFIGKSVVLPVDGNPFLRAEAGRQPQREPEKPGHRRMQRQRAVRGRSMQIDGRAEDRNLDQDDGDDQTENQRSRHAR